MNAKAAKDERRQVRRVLGDDAMKLLRECREAVNAQAAGLLEHERTSTAQIAADRCADLEAQGQAIGKAISEHEHASALKAADDRLADAQAINRKTDVLRRGFFGRLRWLLFGLPPEAPSC